VRSLLLKALTLGRQFLFDSPLFPELFPFLPGPLAFFLHLHLEVRGQLQLLNP
jgi:hypothetical protein